MIHDTPTVTWTPAAPGGSATITLFNSTFGPTGVNGSQGNVVALWGLAWFQVAFLSVSHASATSGLKFYASSDGGANWDQIEAGISIGVTVAGVVDTYRRPISSYRDFKAEYTAGTAPTTWRVTCSLNLADNAKVT